MVYFQVQYGEFKKMDEIHIKNIYIPKIYNKIAFVFLHKLNNITEEKYLTGSKINLKS